MSQPDSSHNNVFDRSVIPSYPHISLIPNIPDDSTLVQCWKYEYRRTAQQILSNIWLGPMSVTRNSLFLAESNIKKLICVTNFSVWSIMPQKLISGISHDGFPISSPHDLMNIFPQVNLLIDQAIQNEEPALIYCESGNEYGAAVIIAYLMERNNWDISMAFQFVHSRRFSITLTDAIGFQVQTYQSIYKARRDVFEAGSRNRMRRMRYEEEEEEEKNLTGEREGVAPFQDF
ncbi:protein-tyrosine phosphatase-like protein [Lipomyces oligophaga]|uniref:protein-tyrosine phosphatase-like protein n=1 Tax=Lipomyces oligophaga TaxID=45792 RepID=UPI0034CE4ED4